MTRRFRHDGDGRPAQARGMVHELVAETAKGMAGAIYEECASSDNAFYARWPSLDAFVRRRWQTFIQPAREQLAEMLDPSKHYLTTEQMREQIHEALLLNAAVNPASNHVSEIIKPH